MAQELEETDAVLGDPKAVERFVLNACQRLGAVVERERDGVWRLRNLGALPEVVQATLPPDAAAEGIWWVCLEMLPYRNQRDHPYLDRHRVRDLLLALIRSAPEAKQGGRRREEQYRWLLERADPMSALGRRFLEHLDRTGRRLPDYAQPHLADYPARPDFYYEAARACIFCDGAVHDRPEVAAEDRRVRAALRDLGYRRRDSFRSGPGGATRCLSEPLRPRRMRALGESQQVGDLPSRVPAFLSC